MVGHAFPRPAADPAVSGFMKFMAPALIACATVIASSCAHVDDASAPNPVVRTEQGLVRGTTSNGVQRFANIPFAAAPVGALRWRAPASPPTWRGVRDSREFGPACPQPLRPALVAGGVASRQSEDCLQLNIWRPMEARRAPVMVWLHGGAHVIGSGTFPAFDGGALARDGVIVVTVNYRLGALGYFAHPALAAEAAQAREFTGNFGLMDQLAALRWVQDNIAAFGGDPQRVTVFGESAGAIDIVTLLASPHARGLFSAAIVQSGINMFEPNTLQQQESLGQRFMAQAGLNADADLDALRTLSVESVLSASATSGAGLVNPFIDGRLVREAPSRAFAEDRALAVPLLIGANSNEASVIFAMGVQPETMTSLPNAEAAARTAYGLPNADREFARQALGDIWFVAPARWLAAQNARRAPTYLYHFDYSLSARRQDAIGAPHGGEVPFVFQTLDYLQTLSAPVSEEDQRFAHALSLCWTAFAKLHQPTCSLAGEWPAYSASRDELVLFGPEPRTVAMYRRRQLDWALSQHANRRQDRGEAVN